MNLLRNLFYSVTACIVLFLTGCGSLLPSVKEETKMDSWNTFDEAKTAFEKIIPDETTKDDLQKIGFEPGKTPNLRILTHLDIIQLFMANPSIRKDDLAPGIKSCIDAKENCSAYEIKIRSIANKRYGSVFLDLLNFKRRTNQTGWKFDALIVMVNGTVVHKLWGGTPIIDEYREVKNPLGPLQDPSGIVKDRATNTLNSLP